MRAAKTDKNQSEIIARLRSIGASVHSTASMGKGFPDLVVGYRGRNFLFEIKDGSKPPSARKLTADQVRFHQTWAGKIHIVNSMDEAMNILTAL